MPVREDTWFERVISPLFGQLLIDREALIAAKQRFDWDAESDRRRNPQVEYPDYYARAHFHGLERGYLCADAALTYDPVTQYALPPNETWVREEFIQRIQTQPRRIVDLGCGTGTLTLMLKEQFPDAEVSGLDLSPYMLIRAEQKAQAVGVDITWRHGLAEATGLPDRSVDLVTIALVFHETPAAIAQQILAEAHRILTPGGEIVMLDGSQASLRWLPGLMDIFEEPYIHDYAQGNVNAWFGAAQFGQVQTDFVWGIHQVTRGVKPLSAGDRAASSNTVNVQAEVDLDGEMIPQLGLG